MRGDTFGCSCKGTGRIKQIDVDGMKVGIIGLDEVFSEYYRLGKKPDDLSGDELVQDLRKRNYIAKGSEEAYKKAFLTEYRKYYEKKQK